MLELFVLLSLLVDFSKDLPVLSNVFQELFPSKIRYGAKNYSGSKHVKVWQMSFLTFQAIFSPFFFFFE